MFILQTTTAVLLAFMALLAYKEVRNFLANRRSRRKHLETPGSRRYAATNDIKPPVDDHGLSSLYVTAKADPMNPELQAHKQLYFKLHNLEHHPDILPECRELLLSLLSSTLRDALEEPESGILSVTKYSHDSLNYFLKSKDVDVTNRWEEYLARRKAGGLREMFSDQAEAKWWLKQAAPVKYVDGAWLGHINKISTPFMYRNITKNAWQVMSEELGDGDLGKNHVHVYRSLMNDIKAGLPDADSKDFIHPRHELNEARCWKAAIAQLLISLFPNDFLPEALGFNMAYESLPLHLLKTVKELRELRLNPYYFELHISIDNADSGHAAMAMSAVAEYIDLVEQTEGPEAAHGAWKRVQAGYILAEGLPTTPESPSVKKPLEELFPSNEREAAVVKIFAAKTFVAHKLHCNSRLRIGRRSLVDWLEPNAFKDPKWQKEFLHDLSNCKPWVIKEDSSKSRLVKELSWEGRMFGSFTDREVEVVKAWIDQLGDSTPQPDATTYLAFTQRQALPSLSDTQDILTDYPVLSPLPPLPKFPYRTSNTNHPVPKNFTNKNFLTLFFTLPTLLTSLPSLPVRTTSSRTSSLLLVLRAQTGFLPETCGVAGMDEVRRTAVTGLIDLGLEMMALAGFDKPANLRDVVDLGDTEFVPFAEWMVAVSMRWKERRDVLVGMAWAGMEVHEVVAREGEGCLSAGGRELLKGIAGRERVGLEGWKREVEGDERRRREFEWGYEVMWEAVRAAW
ncbi:hypothetical protein HBI53_141210 [Parastagonospora nodorum]|nr:hypothetical protein HBI53_141210 [Parastagonospora nodorum]KAH6528954.1 hypothetical protein HBI07_181230 [Parastagonospora nodorum]